MRYSTFFKFVAVVLCAASLLGIVGSAAGIVFLTELGGKSVAAKYEEQLKNQAVGYAMEVGGFYASEHLGGAHRNLTNHYFANDWGNNYFDWAKVGYTLYDNQGNVVLEQEMADGQKSIRVLDNIPVQGQYIKVIRTMTQEEHYLQNYKIELPPNVDVQVMPAQESTAVGAVFVDYTDGHVEQWPGDGTQLGILHYTGGDTVSFHSNIGAFPMGDGWYPCHVRMLDMGGNVVYEASGNTNIISGMETDGVTKIHLPAGQVITSAMAAMNVIKENYRAYDAIPPQGATVAQMTVTFANAQGEPLGSEGISVPDLLGTLFHDKEGNAEFHSRESMTMDIPKGSIITHISFKDAQGNVVFEADCPDGVGNIQYDNNGCLIFQGGVPGTQIQETVSAAEAQIGFAKEAIPVYRAPSEESGEIGMLEAWQEIRIVRRDQFNGESWGLTADGWVRMETVLLTETDLDKAAGEPQPRVREAVPEETEVTMPVPEAVAIPAATEPVADWTEAAEQQADNSQSLLYYDSDRKQDMVAEYVMEPIPEGYTMKIRLAEGALGNELGWTLLRLAEAFRYLLLEALGICIAVFALCVVHLCCSAGRTRRNNEVRAGGLNRIPLDLYLGLGALAETGFVFAAVEGSEYFARNDQQLALVFCGACAYLACLLLVGFCFAFVAQIKTSGGYWWRNTVIGRCLKLLVHCGQELYRLGGSFWKNSRPLAGQGIRGSWRIVKKSTLWLWDMGKRLGNRSAAKLGKCLCWIGEKLARFLGMLPITWQFLLTGFTLVFLLYVVLRSYKVGWILLGFGLFFATILYAASAFAILLESAKRMSKGDLDTKVDDQMLIGGFREFAGELNELADVSVIAVQKQLKSERMKTELITNVSHDIKTPLTSIINYVDLLQKPHTEAEQTQYLEVLDRQSQRLKKLIDDLMEMSKASTGNMSVEIARMDAGETIHQVLGEFADKLERAELTTVFRHPEDKVEMMADGRLVWRVMSNLLGNAVKYAMPGTRIYVDLVEADGKVFISMKNISREELNVQADELLERFVRGDASRNTEGSGLGLNIAQSLMELQKGQLQILVDGDLFKVTLTFPGV